MHSPDIFIHPTAIIDEGCSLGAGVKVWHFSHLMKGCVLGAGCSLGQNVMLGAGVRLGRNVKVQNNVSLYEGLECEDDVFIGPSAVFTNILNPRSAISRKGKYIKTLIRKGASIGANATILCGNEIGSYAFIGAGSVVTKPVPPYALVVGNPARQVGWMSEWGHPLHFDKDNRARCSESGEIYSLSGNQVNKLQE